MLKLQYFGHLMQRADSLGKKQKKTKKLTWCWERLKAKGEGDDRGWDGWMALPTQWTWVWVNFGSWWCTGRPGVLKFMGSQRVGHDWATELNWDSKDIKPVNPKGNIPWIFIGRTNAEAEAPTLWPPDENWLIGKDPDAGKDWRQEEKETTEDKMVGWHHRTHRPEHEINAYNCKPVQWEFVCYTVSQQ